jgi:hypothetical protein
MVLSKSRDFGFAQIPVIRLHANEFFLVNGAVFCRLQLALDLSQQFSHLTLPQRVPKVTYNFDKRRVSGCMLAVETSL